VSLLARTRRGVLSEELRDQSTRPMPARSAGPVDPTERFSLRVADFARYRPTYAAGVIDVLVRRVGLGPQTAAADVGAGTGIATALLLARGCTVFAVEPNADMRKVAEQRLAADYPDTFRSVDGRAEATTLPDDSVDLAVCAQAFHWFDAQGTATEFKRILRRGGHVAVLRNERSRTASPFLRGYDDLLTRHSQDYREHAQKHRGLDEAQLTALFHGEVERHAQPNDQVLDWIGFRGRVMSASYVPLPGQPGHNPLIAALHGLFDRYQADGLVQIETETELLLVSLPA
jgi:SAM-dependent methyltransferase